MHSQYELNNPKNNRNYIYRLFENTKSSTFTGTAGLILPSIPSPEAFSMGKAIALYLIRTSWHILLRGTSPGERNLISALETKPGTVILPVSGISFRSASEKQLDSLRLPEQNDPIVHPRLLPESADSVPSSRRIIRYLRSLIRIEIIIELPENDPYINIIENTPEATRTGAVDWPAIIENNSGNRRLIQTHFAEPIYLKNWRQDVDRLCNGDIQRKRPLQLSLGF